MHHYYFFFTIKINSKLSIINTDQLYDLTLLRGCQISPDGTRIVYTSEQIDRKTDKKYTHIWSVATDGKTDPVQLTYGKQNDTQPVWSPDGQYIAFVSNRLEEKQAQIFILPINGGEARPITDLKGRIGGLFWSPDSQQIAFTFRPLSEAQLALLEDKENKKQGQTCYHYTRIFYKLDGEGFFNGMRWQIGVLNIKDKKVRFITEAKEEDDFYPTWSVDGQKIYFVSNRREEADLQAWMQDIYCYDLVEDTLSCLPAPDGVKGNLSMSPSGKYIAYLGNTHLGEWYRNTNVFLLDLESPDLQVRNLTAKSQYDFEALTLNDTTGLPATNSPIWSQNEQALIVQYSNHGNTGILYLTIEDEQIQPVFNKEGVAAHISMDKGENLIAFHYSTLTNPGQIVTLDIKQNLKQLTKVNEEWMKEIDLGKVETVWFEGKAGNQVQGWIVYPPGFDPEKKYPSILEIHGGPLLQYGATFMHEFFYLAAQGYVVYYCNPRGGKGYGEDHAGAIINRWGTADYEDVMSFADLMAEKAFIDTERMGITGGSYGGYLTCWTVGHTHRFKAAVTQRCVSNLVSMWGSSDMNWKCQHLVGTSGAAPFQDLEHYWNMSPMKYVANVKTPTLVIHSEKDYRCALEQGEQFFIALKKLRVDTELVIFPDESHGLSRGGRMDRRVARLEHIKRWFDKYLQE